MAGRRAAKYGAIVSKGAVIADLNDEPTCQQNVRRRTISLPLCSRKNYKSNQRQGHGTNTVMI